MSSLFIYVFTFPSCCEAYLNSLSYVFDRLFLRRVGLNSAYFQGDKIKIFFWEFSPLIMGNF